MERFRFKDCSGPELNNGTPMNAATFNPILERIEKLEELSHQHKPLPVSVLKYKLSETEKGTALIVSVYILIIIISVILLLFGCTTNNKHTEFDGSIPIYDLPTDTGNSILPDVIDIETNHIDTESETEYETEYNTDTIEDTGYTVSTEQETEKDTEIETETDTFSYEDTETDREYTTRGTTGDTTGTGKGHDAGQMETDTGLVDTTTESDTGIAEIATDTFEPEAVDCPGQCFVGPWENDQTDRAKYFCKTENMLWSNQSYSSQDRSTWLRDRTHYLCEHEEHTMCCTVVEDSCHEYSLPDGINITVHFSGEYGCYNEDNDEIVVVDKYCNEGICSERII